MFCLRNMYIINMKLKLSRNPETFKKHRQAEFQILTFKKFFISNVFIKLARK